MAAQPYLPPGWTEEMYEKPMQYEEAWEALTDEQFRLLQQRRVAAVYPDGIIPKTDNPEPFPAPCVEAVEAAGLTGWGFAIFRTIYGNDEQWVEFQKRFDAMIQEQFDESNGSGIETVRDDLRLHWVEDKETLDGAGTEDVRRYYNEMRSRPEFPEYLHLSMCLMVDSDSISSVLSYTPREFPEDTPIQVRRQNAPWVLAVDAEYGDNQEDYDEDYKGYVKVAISSLINDLFPILATDRMAPEELIPTGNDDVWFSVISLY